MTDSGQAATARPARTAANRSSKPLIVARYFSKEQAAINEMAASLENLTGQLNALEEEHGGEE